VSVESIQSSETNERRENAEDYSAFYFLMYIAIILTLVEAICRGSLEAIDLLCKPIPSILDLDGILC
jgi:hypothetical protein